MKKIWIFCLAAVSFALSFSCKGKKGEESTTAEIPAVGETFYYAESNRPEGIEGTSFQFFLLHRGEKGVQGSSISAPYGTDGMRASFTGVLDTLNAEIRTDFTYYAEGERLTMARDYRLLDSTLAFVHEDRTEDPSQALKRVSKSEYEQLMKDYREQYLKALVNTTDRSRVNGVEEITADLTPEELENLNFLEVAVDLDNNYQTQEYLLMVLGPMYCGSGGCTLFIIDEEGSVLSRTSVVKLPVYTHLQTIEESRTRQGSWKDLFVWSQGMRLLTADEDGTYTANASMGEDVPESSIADHPERYRLLLDYLEP